MLIYCLMYHPLVVGTLCWSLFWYALLYVLSSFAIILTRASWFLLLYCFLGVLLLLMSHDSSSRCRGLVCSEFGIVPFPDQLRKCKLIQND